MKLIALFARFYWKRDVQSWRKFRAACMALLPAKGENV